MRRRAWLVLTACVGSTCSGTACGSSSSNTGPLLVDAGSGGTPDAGADGDGGPTGRAEAEWMRTIEGTNNEAIDFVHACGGDVVVAGRAGPGSSFSGRSFGNVNGFVARYKANGDLGWVVPFAVPVSPSNFSVARVVVAQDCGATVLGTYQGPQGGGVPWELKAGSGANEKSLSLPDPTGGGVYFIPFVARIDAGGGVSSLVGSVPPGQIGAIFSARDRIYKVERGGQISVFDAQLAPVASIPLTNGVGNVLATALGVDAAGKITIAGSWSGTAPGDTVVFGPGSPGQSSLTRTGDSIAFLAWLAADGKLERLDRPGLTAIAGGALHEDGSFYIVGKSSSRPFVRAMLWKNGRATWTSNLPGTDASGVAVFPNGDLLATSYDATTSSQTASMTRLAFESGRPTWIYACGPKVFARGASVGEDGAVFVGGDLTGSVSCGEGATSVGAASIGQMDAMLLRLKQVAP